MKAFLASVTILGSLIAFMLPIAVSAQDPLDAVCTGRGATSAACQSRTSENPLVGPEGILTTVIQIIVLITGIASVIMIMIGGFKYIVSAGESSSVNSAKNTILYAIIGLVVSLLSQAIVSFVLRRL